MYKLKCISLLFAVLAVVSAAKAQDNVIDEVVWVVGDEIILRSQVEEQYKNMQYEKQKIEGDPYCFIPEQMAVNKLFLHQAGLDSITVSDSQVMQDVDRRINFFIDNIGSKEKVEEYFGKPMHELRDLLTEMVRDQSIVQEMQRELVKDIKVTPSDVRRYYDIMPKDSVPFVPMQVEVQVMKLHPFIPQSDIDNIKARLREYTDRVMNGETEFSTLAILYSEDPGSARQGGETGFTGRAEWVPEFADAAFALNDPKKVSKIVETEFGYHIIQLVERRGDRVNVRHILLKPKASDTEKEKSIAKLDSIRNDIINGEFTFEEAVTALSQDKDTRNNHGLMVNPRTGISRFEMADLPQEIAKAIANLQPGEISKPFIMVDQKMGRDVAAIVKLKTRVPGHKANISDDYQMIKSIVENKKKGDFIEEWIKTKQKNTFVRIKDGWQNCEFKYDGWNIKQ
ncbi:MAG: peptidylprolyl isomerase [Bacteroidetes bacterium]|uniref:Peptidylprolyl isomerase n=1 Tax=Candidatus Caccoplasma merdipullorum TaxID=2840718 RepID=A0A9D9H7A9_9BACT|nr:peptidylprolyl isomerase [Candidatus Caccoplasma merdipullorum]